MKKIDLLHTTILIIAILCGYSALEQLLSLLSASFYISDIFVATSGMGTVVSVALLQAALDTIACILLVRNGRRIAAYLLRKHQPPVSPQVTDPESSAAEAAGAEISATDDPDALQRNFDRRDILFVLFIGIGLYTLILYVPALLNELISVFRNQVKRDSMGFAIPPGKDDVLLNLLRVTVGALLIYAAPTLTNFIERTIAPRLDSGSKTT
jgi:hypothetical protein